ncbi:MAG TPA: urea ABC transporter permease subunit UrtB [Steroidobacteraceae bacterium]|nr:urea ABC transporter permease subunit UrtB [Steroidobacteraceae bacterium]
MSAALLTLIRSLAAPGTMVSGAAGPTLARSVPVTRSLAAPRPPRTSRLAPLLALLAVLAQLGALTGLGAWAAAVAAAQPSSTPAAPHAAPAHTDAFAQLVASLAMADFPAKRALIRQIAALHDPRGRALLQAMLDENLYARMSDNRVFITAADGDNLKLTDPLSGLAAGEASADAFNSIDIDNQLRTQLRVTLAQYDLASPDEPTRLAAVREMLRSVDADTIAALNARLAHEPSGAVRAEIRAGLALAALDNGTPAARLAAAHSLADSLDPQVYNRLSAMVQRNPDGSYVEADPQVRVAAAAALREIDHQRAAYAAVQTLLYGLSTGSVLVLAAIGLAITFGVMGVINMAHGELMMLGAYTTYVVQRLMPGHISASILVAIPAAFLVSGLMGIAIERGIVRHLYGRPLETLLATFGVSLILQQAVRDIFTADNRPVSSPGWLSGEWQINPALSITYNHLYIILFTWVVFVLLLLVLKRTPLGLQVRAVSQNRAMARAMGIRTEWVDAFTFGLGSGIAGVAGVALSQLTNVGPNLGQSYIVNCFMVVVFGGVGNLWGTQLGGNALGLVSKVLEPYWGAVLAQILVLVFLILFIQRRPRGLFPQKGRAAEG